MKNTNTAILVFACDKYELLYEGFDYFLNKNWGETISLQKYFATENIDLSLKGYTNLKSGKGEWTNRLKRVLNQIEEKYIIFIQEDMWFGKKVPEKVLRQIIDYTEQNDLKLVKLHSTDAYKTKEINIDFSGFQLSEVIKEDSEFIMYHQVSIWDKNFLYEQLKDNEDPWRNEREGSKRLKKSNHNIYQIDLFSYNNKQPLNSNEDEVEPGGYDTISSNACIHPCAKKYILELMQVKPDYAQQLDYHLENHLTHDGKSKPRLEEIFDKLKKRFL